MMNFVNQAAHLLTILGIYRVLRLATYCQFTSGCMFILVELCEVVHISLCIFLNLKNVCRASGMYTGDQEADGALPL